jgi:hypothetical protein
MKVYVSFRNGFEEFNFASCLPTDYVKKPLVDCTNKPCPKVCPEYSVAPVCAIKSDHESKLFESECELYNQNECVAKSPCQSKVRKL